MARAIRCVDGLEEMEIRWISEVEGIRWGRDEGGRDGGLRLESESERVEGFWVGWWCGGFATKLMC